jgi:hypothetical protein
MALSIYHHELAVEHRSNREPAQNRNDLGKQPSARERRPMERRVH